MSKVNKGEKYINEERYNNFGTLMKVIDYRKYSDITIEFQDEYKIRINTSYSNFKNGTIANPYDKTVCNVGYIGEGKYSHKDYPNIWKKWDWMIQRNYNPYELNKCPTYIDCYVEEDLLCFQNFAEWYEENYYEVPGEKMVLDKDILFKGNKIYSKDTMIFVPERINQLFNKRQNCRGEYPIGVTKHKNRLEARCNTYTREGERKRITIGTFPLSEPFHAFYTYKQFKENYIKQVADEYKDLIPQRLYDAMYSYEVEIND